MAWERFTRSALFAAFAAAGWLPWLVVVGAVVGARTAFSLYLVALTVAYVAAIGRRVAVTAVAAAAGCVLLAIAHGPAGLALGLGAVLAALRSGMLYPRPVARAAVLETLLVGGGLLFARMLAGPGPLSAMLAIWGFFLAQSTFFLVAGTVRGPSGRGDPFDEVRRRALALLDGAGV